MLPSRPMCALSPILLLLLFMSLRSTVATVYWEDCQVEADHPEQTQGNYFNLCIQDEEISDRSSSWLFTKAFIQRTTFKNVDFENREGSPSNFTLAVWEDVAFEDCKFGSFDIEYGNTMMFDKTRLTNVEFKNVVFDHSIEFIFEEFRLENVSFYNCEFKGNMVFRMGTINDMRIHDSTFAFNPTTLSPGTNSSLYFQSCTVNSLNLLQNTFVHPLRFEDVNARDVTLNKTIFDELYCHGHDLKKPEKIAHQSRFNVSSIDECRFDGPVFCEQTTWNGFYGANITFRHDADFSMSNIENIYWDQVDSVMDADNPECHVLNFSQSEINKNTFANISVACDAEFYQTSFTQVRVIDFVAKNAFFDAAIFNEQEYIDGVCCSVACKPLNCMCNVTDPSGLCRAAEWPVNVSAPQPICFPGQSSVQSSEGRTIPMSDLTLKQAVHIGKDQYSDVFFFGHRDPHVDAHYLQLSHSASDTGKTQPLVISHSHYLYVNGRMQAARTVRVGDRLRDLNGHDSLVVSAVQAVYRKGAFAPTSLHGELVVDGVIVSSYTDAIHPSVAHRLLHPLRVLYKAGWHQAVASFTMLERRSWEAAARFLRIPSGPAIIE